MRKQVQTLSVRADEHARPGRFQPPRGDDVLGNFRLRRRA